MLVLIQRPQLKNRARRQPRTEIRQRPLQQRRRRLSRYNHPNAVLLRFTHEAKQRPLPLNLSDHQVQVIDTQAIQLLRTLQDLNP